MSPTSGGQYAFVIEARDNRGGAWSWISHHGNIHGVPAGRGMEDDAQGDPRDFARSTLDAYLKIEPQSTVTLPGQVVRNRLHTKQAASPATPGPMRAARRSRARCHLCVLRSFGSSLGHSSTKQPKDSDDLHIPAGPYPALTLTPATPAVTLTPVGVCMPIYHIIVDNTPVTRAFFTSPSTRPPPCDDLHRMAGPFRARLASPMPVILTLSCRTRSSVEGGRRRRVPSPSGAGRTSPHGA